MATFDLNILDFAKKCSRLILFFLITYFCSLKNLISQILVMESTKTSQNGHSCSVQPRVSLCQYGQLHLFVAIFA